jgi:hypothetical protein
MLQACCWQLHLVCVDHMVGVVVFLVAAATAVATNANCMKVFVFVCVCVGYTLFWHGCLLVPQLACLGYLTCELLHRTSSQPWQCILELTCHLLV